MARGKKPPGTPAGYGAQPTRTAPSAQYGQATAQASAQSAVPLPDMSEGPMAGPGELGPLSAPSMRPGESITTGANFGPGPTTRDLALPRPQPADKLDAQLMKVYLPAMEALASGETSSHELRSFVRRLRAQVPAVLDPTEQ